MSELTPVQKTAMTKQLKDKLHMHTVTYDKTGDNYQRVRAFKDFYDGPPTQEELDRAKLSGKDPEGTSNPVLMFEDIDLKPGAVIVGP